MSVSDNLKNEGVNSRYRVAFRMMMPIEIQEAIAIGCGDHDLTIGDYASLDTILNYDCKTGLAQHDIEQAVSILRSDASLVPLLTLRIVDVKSQLTTIGLNMSPDVRASLKAMTQEKP